MQPGPATAAKRTHGARACPPGPARWCAHRVPPIGTLPRLHDDPPMAA